MSFTFKEAAKMASDLGFKSIIDLRRTKSINASIKQSKDLFKTLSGIYIQFRPNGTIYVGKCRNLPNRHQQHLSQGRAMDYLAFRPTAIGDLDAEETTTINLALSLGLPLVNSSKTGLRTSQANLIAGLEFDDFCPPEAQDEHMARIMAFRTKAGGHGIVAENTSIQHLDAWDEFRQHRSAEAILDAASLYVAGAIPSAAETAKIFWTTSVMISNRQNARLPLLRIICGQDQSLEFFAFSRSPDVVFGTMALAANYFHQGNAAARIRAAFPWAKIEDEGFKAPTADELKGYSPFMRHGYASPEALAKDVVRPITQARMRKPVRLSFPLAAFPTLWSMDEVAAAAAAHGIACLRRSFAPHPEQHNRSVEYEILSRMGWMTAWVGV